MQIVRDKLLELENSMSMCKYISDRMHKNPKEIVERELFMTFPGTKTIYYSIFTPERLYRGPIDMYIFNEFPLIVGESKKDYLMRIIKYRAQRYSPTVSDEKIKSLANIVLDFYCKESSCIAFICLQSFLANHIPLFTEIYNSRYHGELNIYYEIMKSGKCCLKNIFTFQEDDSVELCDMGNLVTLSSYIYKSTISLVDFPDWYNLRQTFLKKLVFLKELWLTIIIVQK